jgi:membrane-associated phospholipid phosphatase
MYWHTLKEVIQQNKWFYYPYLVLFCVGIVVQFSFTQFQLSLFVNGFNNPVLDVFYNYLTDFGDGFFAAAIVVILFFAKRKYVIDSILCFTLPALVTQVLKRLVFSDHYRPSIRMKDVLELHYVPGVNMHSMHSFPSGHTTSAFAVFLFLALITSNKKLGLLYLIIAVFIGISRIYLLQHFYEDVLVGSLIGTVGTTLIFTFIQHKRATTSQ